jgi:hypothetical protein
MSTFNNFHPKESKQLNCDILKIYNSSNLTITCDEIYASNLVSSSIKSRLVVLDKTCEDLDINCNSLVILDCNLKSKRIKVIDEKDFILIDLGNCYMMKRSSWKTYYYLSDDTDALKSCFECNNIDKILTESSSILQISECNNYFRNISWINKWYYDGIIHGYDILNRKNISIVPKSIIINEVYYTTDRDVQLLLSYYCKHILLSSNDIIKIII